MNPKVLFRKLAREDQKVRTNGTRLLTKARLHSIKNILSWLKYHHLIELLLCTMVDRGCEKLQVLF